jgi:hypothetical protein
LHRDPRQDLDRLASKVLRKRRPSPISPHCHRAEWGVSVCGAQHKAGSARQHLEYTGRGLFLRGPRCCVLLGRFSELVAQVVTIGSLRTLDRCLEVEVAKVI